MGVMQVEIRQGLASGDKGSGSREEVMTHGMYMNIWGRDEDKF